MAPRCQQRFKLLGYNQKEVQRPLSTSATPKNEEPGIINMKYSPKNEEVTFERKSEKELKIMTPEIDDYVQIRKEIQLAGGDYTGVGSQSSGI